MWKIISYKTWIVKSSGAGNRPRRVYVNTLQYPIPQGGNKGTRP